MIITLLTDFGTRDYFVGCMKGVILNIHPPVRLVDISHEVEPQNILEAAFLLKSAYRYFPKGTIHVVVVDRPLCGRHCRHQYPQNESTHRRRSAGNNGKTRKRRLRGGH